ncbi:hypothetical protein O7635_15570 [Asanoa sp. WMMD1127]|uniref:hypothetical protein n=1 Tax=Asanoa sp. WMMD1127 TaxID=3016107 RepID=UPI0024179801|nr:hypothetical protein [Asanoa sp. WMMD1127]MDG4823275.1 hypothetical protein [Asanoa sp. WMMD1127]
MTESNRKQYLLRALSDHNHESDPETVRIPLRNTKVLPVIEVPLGLPLLNADSFRIAPQLAEHPDRDLVLADPSSQEAQQIVAELVRTSHRKAEELKANLLAEGGQTQPGVITREGKLINANTRCVLLRELQSEGRGPTGTLRVAVLPSGVTDAELLELEMVLQQQIELKDKYRLVSELMMIQRLYGEGFTDEQIARKLRKKGKDVRESREILALMHRARSLVENVLPLTSFDDTEDRRQNWAELLRDTKALDNSDGYPAGDMHIKRWLIAYFSQVGSVHKLRGAQDDWVERDGVVETLKSHEQLRSLLPSNQSEANDPDAAIQTASGNGVNQVVPGQRDVGSGDDLGLDVLGDEPDAPETVATAQVDAILNLVVAANEAGDKDVQLPDGSTIVGTEVLGVVRQSVELALDSAKRRKRSGGRFNRPVAELDRARLALKSASDALEEVSNDPGFRPLLTRAAQTAEELSGLLSQIRAQLDRQVSNTILVGEEA